MASLETAFRLASAVVKLPAPIVAEAVGHGGDVSELCDDFEFETDIHAFGERLIMIAGLAITAVYVDELLSGSGSTRDPIADYVATLLFRREYDRGIACALVQAVGTNTAGESRISIDDRVVTSFVAERRRGFANQLRDEFLHPIEETFTNLLSQMSFLCNFEFREDSAVTYCGRPLQTWPFLRWNGTELSRFHQLHRASEAAAGSNIETAGVSVVRNQRGEDIIIRTRAAPEERRRIEAIAGRLGISIAGVTVQASSGPRMTVSESVMPLLADTQPQMNRLALMLLNSAEESTIVNLWLQPYLQQLPGSAEANLGELSRDKVLVTNAIIKRCLERDPVAVLTDFFSREPHDARDCLSWLLSDQREIDSRLHVIDHAVDDFVTRVSPFYPSEDDQRQLDEQKREYRGRIVAREVAKLLRFNIVEQRAREDIADYHRRVSAFSEYVQRNADDASAATAIARGMAECAKTADDILRFLSRFYSAIRYYTPDVAEGVTPERLKDVKRLDTDYAHRKNASRKPKQEVTLRSLVARLEILSRDAELTESIETHLSRQGIWPAESFDEHRQMLDELQSWSHPQMDSLARPAPNAIIDRFLKFLEWLTDAEGNFTSRWRIYPAVLYLSVLSTNQCGITSVKYGLTERGTSAHRTITLYTRQPLLQPSLFSAAGVFYGVANRNKTLDDLWLDPVLIPTTTIS